MFVQVLAQPGKGQRKVGADRLIGTAEVLDERAEERVGLLHLAGELVHTSQNELDLDGVGVVTAAPGDDGTERRLEEFTESPGRLSTMYMTARFTRW